MKLSIIIPCYNGAQTLAEQLDALATQQWEHPWELLLADNGSTDDTRTITMQYEGKIPSLRIVDASAKQGTSYARNVGVAAAQAEAVVFVDADDVVAPGYVAAIGEALQKHQAVASAFDYIRLNDQKEQDYMKDNQATCLQQLWYPPYAYHGGGCGLGVRKSVHNAIGGFDESLPRLQDTDYCLRLQQKGIELKFVADALIYIRNRENRKRVFYQGRSWARYNTLLYKQYRGSDRIPNVWRKYLLDWVKITKRLIRQGLTFKVVFQLGWQVGLTQGILLYRTAPAVITRNKSTTRQATQNPPTHHEHQSAQNPQVHP
ncbi:MAG: glycosyltransferase [Ardenticatenaceae bacterium]|nr:glycosyltransferase [Ardenticatenaceae bacterium]